MLRLLVLLIFSVILLFLFPFSVTMETTKSERCFRPPKTDEISTENITANGKGRNNTMTFIIVFWLVVTCCLVSPASCQKQPDSDSPFGASLAFVFDITGSMYDDLVQVIKGAAEILQDALTRREKPLYNYVLVPFHDPGKIMFLVPLFRSDTVSNSTLQVRYYF